MKSYSKKHNPGTWFSITIIALSIILFHSLAIAEVGINANFSWLPNKESDLAGYKIHYGTNPNGTYEFVVDVGNPPIVEGRVKATISNLSANITYYFVATAYNQAGLESEYSSVATYNSASTPPVGTISIAADAATTATTNVILTLSATDAETNVAQMKFSNNNVDWSTAETYNTSKTWALSKDPGIKTVYVKFKDDVDIWSPSYSDTIELTAAPTTPVGLQIIDISDTKYH